MKDTYLYGHLPNNVRDFVTHAEWFYSGYSLYSKIVGQSSSLLVHPFDSNSDHEALSNFLFPYHSDQRTTLTHLPLIRSTHISLHRQAQLVPLIPFYHPGVYLDYFLCECALVDNGSATIT